MKKLTVSIAAHVDSGKTTLSEAMLYLSGEIRAPGRVDRRSTFLDTADQERRRGITIFSKQALVPWKNSLITLLDTPGHADFSGEAERALSVSDCVILVISGTDGIQAHTDTLISLIEEYRLPLFIFVTKMDVSKKSREELLSELKEKLSEGCVSFSPTPDREELALCDECFLEKVISGSASSEDVGRLIGERKVFPVYFGSGLKLEGVESLLDGIAEFFPEPPAKESFAGKVFKISRDSKGRRLTHIKLTGGSLSVKEELNGEKINEIRLYSGLKYKSIERAAAGDLVSVAGPLLTRPGQLLGCQKGREESLISPVLDYSLLLPPSVSPVSFLPKVKELEDEDPLLSVFWESRSGNIRLRLMGKIQTEILKEEIKNRFSTEVEFSSGRVIYLETIASPVEGCGHYEPLKHYAEVHLLLEPLPRGSGLEFASALSSDELDINWQRLILTHLQERQHPGVLTGSPITDMRITLTAGKAHLKHTEGGDFRQATYRALRQGLMKAQSILLEPYYDFRLEVPNECLGRALSDLHSMPGEPEAPFTIGGFSVIRGRCPVRFLSDYGDVLRSYSSGKGRLSLRNGGYEPCADSEKIISEFGYNPLSDLENPPGSVFCSHGAGFNVPWDQVDDYCHIPPAGKSSPQRYAPDRYSIEDAELEEIMLREFGPIKRKKYSEAKTVAPQPGPVALKPSKILVDGYNFIYSREDLKALAADNLDLAREKLINLLVNYSSFTGNETVLVFDAYMKHPGTGEKYTDASLHVVYTKEGETADAYIEKLIDEIGKNESVRVVSSDSMVQLGALRSGVIRVSAREFGLELDSALEGLRAKLSKPQLI